MEAVLFILLLVSIGFDVVLLCRYRRDDTDIRKRIEKLEAMMNAVTLERGIKQLR